MPDWLNAIVLGIVEGLTEFLPVSSTGHLLIVQHWLPRQSDLFNVVIQSGAVLAVLPLFGDRLKQLTEIRRPGSRELWMRILAAFGVTVAGGIVLDKAGLKLPESPRPVAWALIAGGLLFFLVEARLRMRPEGRQMTLLTAAWVGASQLIAAVFPGTSRSGATILGAMLGGISRVQATEFSFLIGIPTLLAASALKILKALKGGVSEDWGAIGIASCAAAITSFVTVKWLLRFVQTHSFFAFGVYRVVVGVGILLFL
jgi:undecaprenyl-diphosphatase